MLFGWHFWPEVRQERLGKVHGLLLEGGEVKGRTRETDPPTAHVTVVYTGS